MKLSYSMALLLPLDLSNLATSKSRTVGETTNPRLRSASRSSDVSILPLRSRSNLSKIAWKSNHYHMSYIKDQIANKAQYWRQKSYLVPSNSAGCRRQRRTLSALRCIEGKRTKSDITASLLDETESKCQQTKKKSHSKQSWKKSRTGL